LLKKKNIADILFRIRKINLIFVLVKYPDIKEKQMNNDVAFIRGAIGIASENIEKGGGPFGAIIVRNNQVISEAGNEVIPLSDPTAHAEILAIRKASQILGSHDLSECTIYSSCEPCPMCLGAIYWSGIKKVVYSSTREDAEKSGFSDKLIYDELTVEPANRRISFIRVVDKEADDVFKKWDNSESRIPY
jgi:tRNA(Arg) A34 adenosine deaminase TadA